MKKSILASALSLIALTNSYAMEQKPEENTWVKEIVALANLNQEQINEKDEDRTLFNYRVFRKITLENIKNVIDEIEAITPINKTLLENVLQAYQLIDPETAYQLRDILYALLEKYKATAAPDASVIKEIETTLTNDLLFGTRFKKILQQAADLRLILALDEKAAREKQK